MHPDPFVRCGEAAWYDALDDTRSEWKVASAMERILLANKLLQVLQDSHTAVSAYDWIWAMEKRHGTIPIRWALEGRALWVLDSGLPGLPEEVRVLAINGREAELWIDEALALSTMEGPSHSATARTGAHNITPWVLGSTQQNSLTITWVDAESGLPTTKTFDAVPLRHARKAWAPISTRRPVVDWIFPDGSHLTQRDDKRFAKEDERLANSGRGRRIHTNWPGAATVKITSFSDGPWWSYHNRLAKGFDKAKSLGVPVVIDLRGNPGGQSPRMESLWRHVAKTRRHLPYALVAKQSPITARANGRFYKRLRKRWVDKHRDTSPDARYIYTMATLPLGETDTLHFSKQGVWRDAWKGPVAVIIDGESASASVSFAGAIQSTNRGVLIGEPCLGPANGTMGNPYMRRLPDSGIVVSISTAVYMAQPCNNWGETTPVQPDLPVDAMWRRQGNLDNTIRDWVTSTHRTKPPRP